MSFDKERTKFKRTSLMKIKSKDENGMGGVSCKG